MTRSSLTGPNHASGPSSPVIISISGHHIYTLTHASLVSKYPAARASLRRNHTFLLPFIPRPFAFLTQLVSTFHLIARFERREMISICVDELKLYDTPPQSVQSELKNSGKRVLDCSQSFFSSVFGRTGPLVESRLVPNFYRIVTISITDLYLACEIFVIISMGWNFTLYSLEHFDIPI